jgi:uncharacterized protein YceK
VRRLRTALIVLCAAIALAGCSSASSSSSSSDSPTSAASSTAGAYALPDDASKTAAEAGLPMLGEEKLAVHYHAHLDLIVRGAAVTVPAGIGIDTKRNRISPLHTHEPDGVVHIESATDVPFTLGQFFTAWGHPISVNGIGSVTAGQGEQLRVYRNGTPVTGDPAALKFEAHDEIVVWIGPANQQPSVPRGFDFPAGE